MRAVVVMLTALVLVLLGTCSAQASATTAVRLPPTSGAFDYQLGGGYRPAKGVSVVTRDSTDLPATGLYSICYVNGFQTQPGATWPARLLLHRPDGRLLTDPGWPDEHLLDISTRAKREAAADRIGRMITRCDQKGFDAVELDNLDSYTRSKGALSRADAIAFATLLVRTAHARGLAVSQKNATDLARVGKHRIGFDFVTAEECDRYSECGAYTKVYGRHVLDVEYTDDLRGSFAAVCGRSPTPSQTVLRDRDLAPRGARGYRFAVC